MAHATLIQHKITSFGDEPYTLTEPIPVEIEDTGDNFVAGFAEAFVYAGGDTADEAIDNLTAAILDTFDELTTYQSQLAPIAEKQFQILSRFITPHA